MDGNAPGTQVGFPISEDLQLITVADIAAMLKVHTKHAYLLCHKPDFPQPIRLGTRRLRWRLSNVRAWMDAGGSQPNGKQAADVS